MVVSCYGGYGFFFSKSQNNSFEIKNYFNASNILVEVGKEIDLFKHGFFLGGFPPEFLTC